MTITISKEQVDLFREQGYLDTQADPLTDQQPVLAAITAASVRGIIATGERAGQRLRRVLRDPAAGVRTGPLCFASRGFSLHAATRIAADKRLGLERLCRYVARPALAAGRLRIIDADQLSFALKTPWSDGTTHLVLSPLELIEKLAALVAPTTAQPDTLPWHPGTQRSGPRQDRAWRRKRARGAVQVDPPALSPSPVLVPVAGARVCH